MPLLTPARVRHALLVTAGAITTFVVIEACVAGLALTGGALVAAVAVPFVVPVCFAAGWVGVVVRAARRRRSMHGSGAPHLSSSSRAVRTADQLLHGFLLANAALAGLAVLAWRSLPDGSWWLLLALLSTGVVGLLGAPCSVWVSWRSALDRDLPAWEAAVAHRSTGAAHRLRLRRGTVLFSHLASSAGAVLVLGTFLP